MPTEQPNNPLHGVTLQALLEALVARHGWAGLAERVPVKCFQNEPSMGSSLAFLRKTPWARAKVEALYVELARKQRRNRQRAERRAHGERVDADSAALADTEGVAAASLDEHPGVAALRAAPRHAARPVLKVLTTPLLETLLQDGVLAGAPVDLADGFVHLSAPEQVEETLARHFAGQRDLWLVTLDAATLGDALRWEPSRGGALFPHLYAPLRWSDVVAVARHLAPAGAARPTGI